MQSQSRFFVQAICDRVASSPETLAYTFLKEGLYRAESITLGKLDRKARAIAAVLQAHCTKGDRVLLVYPQSIEAIAAFLGCLYAGVVAVPAPAPETTRLKRVLPRLEAIAADAGANVVLSSTKILQAREGWQFTAHSDVQPLHGRPCLWLHYRLTSGRFTESAPQLTALPWIATDKLPPTLATQWQAPDLQGDTLAYLQYTSGSTSTPKGVMLDHDNLMGHLAALQRAGGYTTESVTVTWMPYFHDYGLVEGMLLPLYNGTPCYLMSPTAFIKRPLRWLTAISRYRATHSQAPNFAYAYCVRRIAPEDCADLDLSHWQAAGNAAEPINSEVIDEFCAAFTSCGFQRQAFAPAYGLAEATLLVTTSRKGEEPLSVELAELSGRWVSCGRLLPGTRVEIVNPDTQRRCKAQEVGEIWVASAGVARGFWQRQEETAATFGAVLADTGEGGFLRTGDLGFLRAGELFVTGRLKDLIIVRGENYYPQDIEWAVERCHPALRHDAGAAFAVDTDGEERVVVVWECEAKTVGSLEPEAILAAVRSTVAEQFELPVQAVVLLKRGSIFKTSSGKIQRRACRRGFLAGQLAELARWEMGRDESAAVDLGAVEGNPLLVQVMKMWRQVLGVATVRETDNFFELGGDSLKAAMLISEVEQQLRVDLTFSSLAEAPTPAKFLELVRSQHEFKSPLVPVHPTGCKIPFFYVGGGEGQLLPYLDPERPVYGFRAIDFHEPSEPLETMDAVVQWYVDAILTLHADRPYLLGGRCFGGNVAMAMAQELKRRGKTVLLVTMADSHNPVWTEEQKRALIEHWPTEGKAQLLKKHQKFGLSRAMSDRLVKRLERHLSILQDYVPQKYSGRVVYFSAEENQDLGLTQFDPMQPGGWNDWVEGSVEIVKVPGRHGEYHNPPHVAVYAQKLNACLESVEGTVG
jgi:acyl-CoA synthetase (AMP-forming)/AMP-acid ligase II/thioesterase domain-containing protein/acyl carrier protein